MAQRPKPPRLENFRPSHAHAAASMHPSQLTGRGVPPTRSLRPPPRRGAGLLRALAWVLGGLVAVAACLLVAVLVADPSRIVRDQLVREVKARTGRDLVVAGPTSLALFPSLGVALGDVALSSPPGMGGDPLVRMRRLEASVPLLALLQGAITVERLSLIEPVFELRVDARGRRSWDFAMLSTAPRVQLAQAGSPAKGGGQLPPDLADFLRNSTDQSKGAQSPPAGGGGPRSSPSLDRIALGDVRIENGTVRYRDERSGAVEEVGSVNARLAAKSLASPLDSKGDFALRGDRVAYDLRLSSPKAVIEQRPARLTIAFNAPRATGRFEGSLATTGGPQLDGALRLETTSLRQLAAWAGARLPDNAGLGPLALKGDIKTGPTWVSLANAELRLDGITGTGSASADVVGGRPQIKANLKIATLDLNPYLAGGSAAPSAAPGRPASPATTARPDPIEELLRSSQPPAAPAAGEQVKGYTPRSGWSDAAIDLQPMGLVDVEARLSISRLIHRALKLADAQIGLQLKSGLLQTTLDDVKLYEGRGRGTLALDGRNRVPSVAVNLALDGVSGQPLLADAAGFDWIAGKARITLALAGQGQSERAIVESLAGKVDVAVADGAIVGFNIPQMIRGLSQGRLSGFDRVASEKTDFSEAAAAYVVKAGVAETKDLRMASPLMRLTGTGTIGIGQRQVDMTLRPRLVATLSGQGGPADLSGLEIPLRIRGPWEKTQIRPDLDAVLKDPGKAVEAIKEIGKQFQGKGASEVLKGILGGGNTAGEQSQGEKGARTRELLKEFLKR